MHTNIYIYIYIYNMYIYITHVNLQGEIIRTSLLRIVFDLPRAGSSGAPPAPAWGHVKTMISYCIKDYI